MTKIIVRNTKLIPPVVWALANQGQPAEPGRLRARTLCSANCYTGQMMDEQEFRRLAESALSSLMQHLIAREAGDDAGFEVEEQAGALNILFEEAGSKFVITPNTPVRQLWISALSTSFKLDWNDASNGFILPRTSEQLIPLIDRLVDEQLAR